MRLNLVIVGAEQTLMTKEEFTALVRQLSPTDLTTQYFASETTTAFPDADDYAKFKARVRECVSGVESVSIVGTGNWRFSLNPRKWLKEFDDTSDIDVAVISLEQFTRTWEELRRVHRSRWYSVPFAERENFLRNGQNVYAGFISPAWISDRTSKLRYSFKRTLNRLTDKSVAFRPVRMLYFKNSLEAIDYYKRGFLRVRREVVKNDI